MTAFFHVAGSLTVHLVEAGTDNYVYVVAWDGGSLVVDPGDELRIVAGFQFNLPRSWSKSNFVAVAVGAFRVARVAFRDLLRAVVPVSFRVARRKHESKHLRDFRLRKRVLDSFGLHVLVHAPDRTLSLPNAAALVRSGR